LTINDIARLAEVSKKTVSRVINQSPYVREETRTKINAIISEYGFEPDLRARGLALRKSFLFGLIYDNPNAQYIVNIQRGMLDVMRGTDFELVVHPCAQSSPQFLSEIESFVGRQKLFGVVLLPPVSENDRLVALLREIDCEYVRIASVSLDSPDHMIVAADPLGARAATEHLLNYGHRRIGFITGPQSYRSTGQRLKGFAEALRVVGLTPDPDLIFEGAYTFESGVTCGTALCRRHPRPTAIFAANDEMAAGVYQAARSLGLQIPAEVSVIGYDDSPLATRIWPPLTTVRQPIPDMGRMAAERLLSRGRGITRFEPIELTPQLIIRGSVGPPAA
jgi:LacI family transcriptional regulator